MKQKAGVILTVFTAIAIAVVLTAGGCTKKEEAKQETTNITETEVATEKNWTNSTARGDIEDKAISGKINDKSVAIKNVQVEEWDGEYSWSFSNQDVETTCGVIVGNDAVNFSSKI